MKKGIEVNKELLKLVQNEMDRLYVESKKMLEMDGPKPEIGYAMDNIVKAQTAFDLLMNDLMDRHREDGNLCPVIIAAMLTKLYVNSLGLEPDDGEKVVLGNGLGEVVKSLSSMAANPLAMYVWDRHVKETLETEMKGV